MIKQVIAHYTVTKHLAIFQQGWLIVWLNLRNLTNIDQLIHSAVMLYIHIRSTIALCWSITDN